MQSTIEQTKEAILKHGGKASKHQIARELKISLDYAGLILSELKRKGDVAFSDGFYALTVTKKNITQNKGRKKLVASSKKFSHKIKKLRAPHLLSGILKINEALARTLEKAGYPTIESLADAPINRLMDATKLKLPAAAQLINQARRIK